MPIIDLPDTHVAFATVEDLATFVQRDFDEADTATAELILGIASDTIRTFTRQTLSRVDNDELVMTLGWVFGDLWLPERPVIDLTSVTIDDVLAASTSYAWSQSGLVSFFADTYSTSGRATIVYGHGFDPLPRDIQGICLEMARAAISVDSAGIASEAIGNYAITFDVAAASVLTESQQARLLPYRPPITSVPITSASAW